MPICSIAPAANTVDWLELQRVMGEKMMGRQSALILASLAALTMNDLSAQLNVRLANGSDAESATRAQLLALVEEYDVSDWIYTREILIDQDEIPHSHPVLTLHTRHLQNDEMLLSTFIHEQFHWLEDGGTLAAFRAAMTDFEELYAEVPDAGGGGARDVESTYRHLIVCDLEFQGMTRLVGEARARELMARVTHYEWIYQLVLTDPRVREVNGRHGFFLSK